MLKIHFDPLRPFSPENFLSLDKVVGLYFISITRGGIGYPFKSSQLIYIGMSERTSSSIASRLKGHFDGSSGNAGLVNYRKAGPLLFTYLNFDSLKSFWKQRIEDLESYFIQSFVHDYGVYPICNNKTGFPDFKKGQFTDLQIDWDHFLKQGNS